MIVFLKHKINPKVFVQTLGFTSLDGTASFVFCSLFNNLAPQVAGDITDVEPAVVVLCYQLGEADLSRLLHLYDELEQAAVVGSVPSDEVCSAAEQVVAVLGTAHEVVELTAAVAAAHDDGLAPRLTYGVKELVY